MSKLPLIICTAIQSILLLTPNAIAADIYIDDNKKAIIVKGELVEGDISSFQTALKSAKVKNINTVLFSSPGGNLLAGLRIGEAIRNERLHTSVEANGICASACGLAWLGGVKRFAQENASVGFHASYIVKNGQKRETGSGNALVGAYLSRLGLSDIAIVYVTRSSPNQMSWLTPQEGKQIGIEYDGISTIPKSRTVNASILSLDDFEIAIDQNPIMLAMKYEQPTLYKRIMKELYDAFLNGATDKEIVSIGTSLIFPFAAKKMLTAPDSLIFEWAAVTRVAYKKLEQSDPGACVKAHNGEISIINSMLDANRVKKIFNDLIRHHPIKAEVGKREDLATILKKAMEVAIKKNENNLRTLSKLHNNDRKRIADAIDFPKNDFEKRLSCTLSNDVSDEMIKSPRYPEIYRYILFQMKENKNIPFRIR